MIRDSLRDLRGAPPTTVPSPCQPGGVLAAVWRANVPTSELPAGEQRALLRVPNPMPGGRPLRFANQDQDRDLDAWLTLGAIHP